ncbi:MAG TPA: hypothetical protein ENL20_06345, partial [Candidatus Cloacimonetes bacterium]|nr:hypothetical protein [Candidatus Cloacimonadota bacterium]
MRKKTFTLIFITLIILSYSLLMGDNLEETLGALVEDAAISYVDPVVSAFGSNLNGGWFHRVPDAKKIGFDLEIGFVGMATFFTEANKSFHSSGNILFGEDDAEKMTEFMEDDPDLKDYREDVIDAILEQNIPVEISGPTVVGSADENIVIYMPEYEISFDYYDSAVQDTLE